MPNSLIDDLLKSTLFTADPRASAETPGVSPASEALRGLTSQLEVLRGLYQAQTGQVNENTAAVVQNTRSKSADVGSKAIDIARTAGGALGGGLTLFPLISGIAKLFGFGDGQQEPISLPHFALPSSVALDGSISQNGTSAVSGVSYGQSGLPRANSTGSNTNIQLNIQTMDSKSFLDHSDDIARAVREAMLNSHPLNDVVAEI